MASGHAEQVRDGPRGVARVEVAVALQLPYEGLLVLPAQRAGSGGTLRGPGLHRLAQLRAVRSRRVSSGFSRCSVSVATRLDNARVTGDSTDTSRFRHSAAMYSPAGFLMPMDVLFAGRPSGKRLG